MIVTHNGYPRVKGVEIKIDDANIVTVKGKLGELTQKVDPDIKVEVEDGSIIVSRPTEQKRHKSLHGLYRSILANMVQGVSEGFQIKQELVGVGYKASVNNNQLELALGYSHNIVMVMPPEVKVEALTERGKNPLITLTSVINSS